MAPKRMPVLTLVFFLFSLARVFAQLDLMIDRVEVTQVIQDRNVSIGQDNLIRLVGLKTTVARVYVSFTGSNQPVPNVNGIVRVYQNGVEVDGSPVTPDSPITAPVPPISVTRVDPRSADESNTLNFTLPPLMGDNIQVVATVNPDRTIPEINYNNNSLTVDGLNFECRRVPDIVYQPINYRPTPSAPNPNLPDPDLIAPGVGDAFVRGIYPIYDLSYRPAPGDPIEWNQDINRSTGTFQNQMATRRQMMIPLPDFMFSWFPGNPYTGNGQANPAGLVAFGNTDLERFQRTFAHELGHLFGRSHNTTRLENVGFDAENQLGLGRPKDTTFKDVMWAGQLTDVAWVAIVTYNAFLDRPVLRCSDNNNPTLGAVHNYGDYLFLTGIVRPDGRAQLNPAYKLTGPQDYTPPSENPTHWLVLQDRVGNELYRLALDVRMPEYDGDDPDPVATDAPFSAILPVFPDLGRVILEQNGAVLAALDRRPDPPVVDLDPLSTTIVGKGRLAWQARNAEPGALTYAVQYSPDDGDTWYPLAVDVTDTSLLVDSATLGKTDRGILRVLATDGLNTTTVERRGVNVF